MRKVDNFLHIMLLFVLFTVHSNAPFAVLGFEDGSSNGISLSAFHKHSAHMFDKFSIHSMADNMDLEEEEREEREEGEDDDDDIFLSKHFPVQNLYKNFPSHSGMIYLWDYNQSPDFYTYFDSTDEFDALHVVKETIVFLI